MKILQVSGFPNSGAGSGTLMTTQAEGLIKKGHSVHTIIAENQKDFPKTKGITYSMIPYRAQTDPEEIDSQLPFNFPMFTTHTRSTESFWNLSMEQIEQIEQRYRQEIAKTIDTFDPDVIHGQHLWLHSGVCSEFDLPLVVTVHGTDLMGIEEARRRGKEALDLLNDPNTPDEKRAQAVVEAKRALHYAEQAKKAATGAQKILVISKDQQEKLHRLYPELDEKVELLENGYNPEVFYPLDGVDRQSVLGTLKASNTQDGVVPTDYDNMALFVGKFADFKGIDFILDAAKKYETDEAQKGKKAITVIVGSGEREEALQAQAKALGLKDTYFVGRKQHDTIRQLQALADVALVPSREEPFGLVVIEATACGTPVIGTNSGGIPDILNTTGLDLSDASSSVQTDLGILIPYSHQDAVDAKGKPIEDKEKIASDLATAVEDVFDENITFDSDHIAEYTRQNYDQNVINDRLIGYFNEAIAKRQEGQGQPREGAKVLKRAQGRTIF